MTRNDDVREERALHAFLAACRDSGMSGTKLKGAMSNFVLPKDPPPGLLMSMAMRYDHGLGLPGYYDSMPIQLGPTHKQRLESTLRTMRQLYEEVSGHGFYSPDKEAEYATKAQESGIHAQEGATQARGGAE